MRDKPSRGASGRSLGAIGRAFDIKLGLFWFQEVDRHVQPCGHCTEPCIHGDIARMSPRQSLDSLGGQPRRQQKEGRMREMRWRNFITMTVVVNMCYRKLNRRGR